MPILYKPKKNLDLPLKPILCSYMFYQDATHLFPHLLLPELHIAIPFTKCGKWHNKATASQDFKNILLLLFTYTVQLQNEEKCTDKSQKKKFNTISKL